MIAIEKINNCFLQYEANPSIHTKTYYNFCLDILKNKIKTTTNKLNIFFGKIKSFERDGFITIRIDIQYEHTLVKNGGRSIEKIIFGNIPFDENEKYLVRIVDEEYFSGLDLIIDYSLPNIFNIKESKKFEHLINKLIYIAPLIYPINLNHNQRDKIITFHTPHSLRRDDMVLKINHASIECMNYHNIFDDEKIINLYDSSKILINLHQTDHHHTFEELRVLPALSRGVIIVSEDVPLKEKIPYNKHIIWSKFENIPETVKKVNNNYNDYRNIIFNNELIQILNRMKKNNDFQI